MVASSTDNTSSPAVEINGLVKIFRVGFWGKRVPAVDGVDLTVYKNEIFGFLGPNGAGKTTTIKAMLRLIFPTRGEIKLLGVPHTDVAVRGKIGFLPENPYFYDYLTAKEFMVFYGYLLGMDRKVTLHKTTELLKKVGLDGAQDLQLRKFSKGMLQRIGLAQALLNDPELVILDEPMSGLDPLGRKEIRDLILSLKKEGKTVFFSTHILPDVEMICDRVGIIRKGKITAVGALDEILKTPVEDVEVTVEGIEKSAVQTMGVNDIVVRGDTLHFVVEEQAKLNEILKTILDRGGKIVEVSPRRESLESYFVRVFDSKADTEGDKPR